MKLHSRWSDLKTHEKLLIGLFTLCIFMLITSQGRHSRDYFTLMRFAVFCTGALAAWYFSRARSLAQAVLFGATALLFNPFAPVRLLRATWEPIDYGVAILFAVGGFLIWRKS